MLKNSGYKHTEIGVIPGDWQIKTIDQIFYFSTNSISTQKFNPKYYVSTENMLPNKKGIKFYNHSLTAKTVKEYKRHDILFSNIRPYLKKVWFAENDGGCSADVIVFRNQDINKFDSKLLYYLLSEDKFFNYANSTASGTKMPRGDKSLILQYLVPIANNLKEQQSIAEVLSDVDNLIISLHKIIDKKRAIKQGAMHDFLTGKRRLSSFNGEWVGKNLGNLGNFVSGNTFPIFYQGNNIGEIPFYKVSDFSNSGNEKKLTRANNYITKTICEKLKCNIIPKNSIIFAKIGRYI